MPSGMSFYVHQHEGLKLLVTQWCPYNIHLWQLQGVLNAAARLIARRRKFDSISSKKCDNLHWLRIQQRVDFKLSVLMFNCLRNLAPSYLMNMCRPVTSNRHRRRLNSFCCAWRPHRSIDEGSPLRSTQLCCRWAVNVEWATCTTMQRRTLCHVISSPAEDWTIH